MSFRLSPRNVNTPEFWEDYHGVQWEKNQGRKQTRLFAEYFAQSVRFPRWARSLLDVGCAMGDALPVFHQQYPSLRLTGCDVSATALARAKESYGEFAEFRQWTFDEIEGEFDVIYCSNTFEHFESHLEIAEGLLSHCRLLYVLVPYRERHENRPLDVQSGQQHVASFDQSSFDPLVKKGLAKRVRHWIRHTPGAWGDAPHPLLKRIAGRLGMCVLASRNPQIFYEITSLKRDAIP